MIPKIVADIRQRYGEREKENNAFLLIYIEHVTTVS